MPKDLISRGRQDMGTPPDQSWLSREDRPDFADTLAGVNTWYSRYSRLTA